MLAPCPYPSPLGTAVCIRAQALALATCGHDVHIVTYGHVGCDAQIRDAGTTYHPVSGARVQPISGPQSAKDAADWRLWRYARALGKQMSFDVIYGHHVEGMALGALLRRSLRIPLVGHVHTQLGLELPSYVRHSATRTLYGAAGHMLDRVIPRAVDALVTLSVADAQRCRPCVPHNSVFVRYPVLSSRPHRAHGARSAAKPYAIYSGNADAYQNLGFLCAASRQQTTPLVLATHGPTLAFDAYRWPTCTRIVRVESFEDMHAWLLGAVCGLSPRHQSCGYPIKWLNYWQARLTLVALEPVGRAVFGEAMDSAAHGPTIWTKALPNHFAAGMRQALNAQRTDMHDDHVAGETYDAVFAAAHANYRLSIINRFF